MQKRDLKNPTSIPHKNSLNFEQRGTSSNWQGASVIKATPNSIDNGYSLKASSLRWGKGNSAHCHHGSTL